MADRVKAWDVESTKDLRRNTGAHDGFTDNEYYTQWRGAQEAYHNGSASSLFSRIATIALSSGFDKYVVVNAPWRDYWKSGDLVAKSRFLHKNSVASATVEIETSMFGYELGDPSATATDSVGFNTGDNQIITLDNTGSFTQSITVTTTSTTVPVLKKDRNLLGIRHYRLGSTGTDTYTDVLHYVGTWIIWKPTPRS